MRDDRVILWSIFENSGEINDYLKYKLLIDRPMIEAGEDFGFDKDLRDSSADNKIR